MLTEAAPFTAALPRVSARRDLHHVNLFCVAPKAQHVTLVGDFNDWDPAATPLCRMPDGCWMASLELPRGYHQYLFIVDGRPVLDPKARGIACSNCNGRVSVLAVSSNIPMNPSLAEN